MRDKEIAVSVKSEILSRLAVYIALSGWLMLGFYVLIINEYTGFSPELVEHFISTEESGIRFRALILFAPFTLTVISYLVNERAKLFKKTIIAERELRTLFNGLILAFANTIDAKSKWTKGHSERVAAYALTIAEEMNLDEKERNTLKIAAILHDIGKIGTYDVILDKTGPLTGEEQALIRMHPDKGADIIKHIEQLQDVIPVVRHHHERFDGNGYPGGLKGDGIPMLARILCVADSFDAIIEERPYKASMKKEDALSEIKRRSGTQFDPQISEVFLRVMGYSAPDHFNPSTSCMS
jgi:putative nucleotidyltransferase with HDIG domain